MTKLYVGGVIDRVRMKVLPNRPLSYLNEERLINHYLSEMQVKEGFCVDIAAGDGLRQSNTLRLLMRGFSGFLVELNPLSFSSLAVRLTEFERVKLARCKVDPDNVAMLLAANAVPNDFEFLSLDIDSYDYDVLDAILKQYRPKLIITEINERIPPPIKFAFRWKAGVVVPGNHVFGQSIAQVHALAQRHGYVLLQQHYNNAFLAPLESALGPALSAEQAYDLGYKQKADRLKYFPWNRKFEPVLDMQPEAALHFLQRYFGAYKDSCDLYL